VDPGLARRAGGLLGLIAIVSVGNHGRTARPDHDHWVRRAAFDSDSEVDDLARIWHGGQ
jgi:hypothetical protein